MHDPQPTIADVTDATRLLLDVLAMRTGPTDDGMPFRMTCVPVASGWSRARRERAELWAHAVPDNATHADVPRLAARLAVAIRAAGTNPEA